MSIVFIVANTVDTDEMPHSVAFHLSLHCLLNVKTLMKGFSVFTGFPHALETMENLENH